MAFLKKLKNIKWKHYISYILIAVVLIVFIVLGDNAKRTDIYMLEKIAIAIILSVSLSFVVGFLGELSLGHAGFMCIGAYLGGTVAQKLVGTLGNNILTVIIAVVAGGLCAAVVGVVVGIPVLRLKGDYLAIVTLAFGEIVWNLFLNSDVDVFGGAFGLTTPRYDYHKFFIIALVLALITIACFQNIIRSQHGRAITAIRDNEIAAKSCGVNVTKYKMYAFVMSAFFAGVAGVLYSFTQSRVQAVTFDYNYSIDILVMVVLGGMGSLNGSVFAAILITFINEKLSVILTGNLAVLQKIAYAVILVLVIIFSNAPGLKNFREKYNFKKLWNKISRKKHNPEDISNDEGEWNRIPTKIPMDEMLSVDINISEKSDNNSKGAD